MQSDAIDRLLGSYLKQPVSLRWEGTLADVMRGHFDEARLELAGLATRWLSLERLVVSADHVRLTPGIPARLALTAPRVTISLGQHALDRWIKRFGLPFHLTLGDRSLHVATRIAGMPIGEFEAGLEVVDGWFVLKPRSASFLGVPNYVASLFRTYLPLPPVSPDARLVALGHHPGELDLTFALDDFEDDVTPGLADRLRRRILPLPALPGLR